MPGAKSNFKTNNLRLGPVNETDNKENTDFGKGALTSLKTGSGNTAIGFNSATYLTTGTENIFIGSNSLTNLPQDGINNCILIGSNTVSGYNSDNCILIGNNTSIKSSNSATIGNEKVTDVFLGGEHGQSTMHAKNLLTISDERVETEITTATSGLDFIKLLNPVTFKYKNPADYPEEILNQKYKTEARPTDDNKKYFGLIAQDITKSFESIDSPEWNGIDESNGLKSINYISLIMPLINAVKELSKKNDELTLQINEIKGNN